MSISEYYCFDNVTLDILPVPLSANVSWHQYLLLFSVPFSPALKVRCVLLRDEAVLALRSGDALAAPSRQQPAALPDAPPAGPLSAGEQSASEPEVSEGPFFFSKRFGFERRKLLRETPFGNGVLIVRSRAAVRIRRNIAAQADYTIRIYRRAAAEHKFHQT